MSEIFIRFLTTIVILAIANLIHAQSPTIHYTYDASGNRTSRTIVYQENPTLFPDTSDNDLAKENQLENLQPEQQKYEEQISNGQVLSIFPNPTQGLLHVQLSSTNGITSQPATLEILDINGKKHYSNQSFLGNESINMVTFPSGIYFLKLDIGGQKTEWKIVRQ